MQHKSDYMKKTDNGKDLQRRLYRLIFALGILTCFLITASLLVGLKNYSFKTLWESVTAYDPFNQAHQIIYTVRLPRIIGALLTGTILGICGLIMQSISSNPLGDPSLLGVSGGASVVIAVSYAISMNIGSVQRSVIAMAGAALAMIFVSLLSGKMGRRTDPLKLMLAGTAVSNFFGSLSLIIGIRSKTSRSLSFWIAGSLAGINATDLVFLTVSLIVILLIILYYRKDFALMVLGDELSTGLGANVDRARKAGLLVVVIGTGISVSVIGNVGFVGLCVPHIARLLFGSRFSFLLPVVAVMSAFLLGAADFMARSASAPLEIPVGAITALIGAPFFLYLARTQKKNGGRTAQ
jgi:iron complex transport system permease protein